MSNALSLLLQAGHHDIEVLTSNKAAMLALKRPRQQSGQGCIRHIYDSIKALGRTGTVTTILWCPSRSEDELLRLAKENARKATERGSIPQVQLLRTKATTLRAA